MVVLRKQTCLCSLSDNNLLLKNCLNCDQLLNIAKNFTLNLKSGYLKSQKKKFLSDNLLDICEGCSKMAAIPQGAFFACKLREQYRERELMNSRQKSDGSEECSFSNEKPDPKYFMPNKKMLKYSPVKYNSKLMNSIWGFYNRYSPHNIKSNDDVEKHYILQQPNAVAGFAIASDIAVAMNSAKEWGFVDK